MDALTASTTAPGAPPALALRVTSDERLARWAAAGSQAAFAVIFERHHQALHRYCRSIVGNGHDAADALQNTMLKALRALPGETRTIALKPWLYRIAHNESISLVRARCGDAALDAAVHVGGSATDAVAESRERLRDLTCDLGELTEQQRGTLLMRELGGLEFDEISGALQITATAAKQSLYEARCSLQFFDEGREMECEVVRRTLSDGDRRTLRNMKLRGHLRACAGCREFETALHHRPADLAALAPPLPLTAAASMLQGLLGTGAGHGGMLAAIVVGGNVGGALSVGAAEIASAVVIAGGVAGGAVYVVPGEPAPPGDSQRVMRQAASAASHGVSPPAAGELRGNRVSRRAAPAPGSTGAVPARSAPASVDRVAAAGMPKQPPAANPAPPAVAAGGPSLPAAGDGEDGAPVDAGGERARRPAESQPAPAAAAEPRWTRPAASAPPEVAPAPTSSQPSAATTVPSSATTRQPPPAARAPAESATDAVAPVLAPRPG